VICCGLHNGPATASTALAALWGSIHWGISGAALLEGFGQDAMVLSRPIDFGDSYTQIVLRDVSVGGLPLIAFFQMDKATGGLKRVQLERQRHGVNPPAFRAVAGGLQGAFGSPDGICSVAPGPWGGYQGATELFWLHDGNLIRAVFRDTTIEAVEGCLGRDLSAGPCGLTGQLIVRISPATADQTICRSAHPR
jgi:hypothetical protein